MDPYDIHDFNWQLEAPACIMISGMTGSGKSWLTKSLLERANEVFDKPVHKIVWCFTEYQAPLMAELKKFIPSIEFHKGLPDEIDNPNINKHMVLVLDDLIHECKNAKMQAMFVRGSHHHNCSVIYLTQNAFAPGQRTISLQCKYCALMNNPRDSAHYQHLGRAMNGGKNCPVLDAAYKECCQKPHGYVVLDFSQNQDNKFRIRSSFFPEDMIVFTKKE